MSVWPTPPAVPLNIDLRMGDLKIGGIELMTPAWVMLDLKSLWETATVRGQDRLLPGTAGVKAYRRRATVTKHALPMVISGYYDRLGSLTANPFVGLENNVSYLRSNVADPTNVGDGTRAASLTMPSGQVRTGNVHVLDLILGNQGGPIVLATLDIEIPLGVLS